MKNSTCVIIQAIGGVLYITPFEEICLNWTQLSPAFALDFFNVYQKATNDVYKCKEKCKGLNELNILEKMGKVINEGKITTQHTFSDVYHFVVEANEFELAIA